MQGLLITGAAGFIGYHVSKKFAGLGYRVYGLDNMQDGIEHNLKGKRLKELGINTAQLHYGKVLEGQTISFFYCDLNDTATLKDFFLSNKIDIVIHLAAQTGVRNSVSCPEIYFRNNISGFQNILQACRLHHINKLIFASSSSVYGENKQMPYHESFATDNPVSVYAATKKANEIMASAYSNLFGMHITGLRFFTVYGPWVRTDMASYIFMKAISEGKTLELFNHGRSLRDFTYVDDVVTAIQLIAQKMTTSEAVDIPKYNIFNVGNSRPVELEKYLNSIETLLGKKANIVNKPKPEGDVTATYACVDKLFDFIGFKPDTPIEQGVKNMVDWYVNMKQ